MRAIFAGLVLMLFLAGCGSSSNTNAKFINVVRANVAESQGTSNADIITLGHSICGSLNSGTPLLSVVETGINSGFSPSDAGYVVGASVAAYCPQYKNEIYQLQQQAENTQ